ncbi:MAG: hypothetical protein K2X46_08690, partial [Roseomonas sp.]|nr:hypothetical protein [Roseomonas sp.]
ALSTAAGGSAAPAESPRSLFPLIEALDLPGGMPGGMPNGMAGAMPARRDAAPPPYAIPALRARSALVPAAEVEMALPDLFRLLAAGPAGSPDAYSAMRRPARADRPTN